MIDSTNPRIMANNIRELSTKIEANDVVGNPTGSGYNTLLTKIKIDGNKFKLPADVSANPADEATDEATKLKIGSTVYSLGGGGGYTPNYSETESEVGINFGDKPVYGKLVALAVSSITTSWAILTGDVTYSEVEHIIKADIIADETNTTPANYPVAVYADNRSNGNHKLYGKTFVELATSGTLKYIYLEYTKITQEG